MAEFQFWGANEDIETIIRAIFAAGDYQLIPDLHYEDPNPLGYSQLETALLDALARKKRLYIVGPYSEKPAFMEQITEGPDDGCYFISEARGGPVLSLTVPGCKVVDEMVHLAPGSFSRRSEFWDDAITTATKASDELKRHYEIIRGVLKGRLVRKKIIQPIWIGPVAWELLNESKALILSKGKWWDKCGNFVKSNLNERLEGPVGNFGDRIIDVRGDDL